jgi:trigger factor
MMNMSPEVFRENTRAGSEQQVKIRLALEKIAELEGIEVSDDQVEDEYIKASENLNMEIDKLKESVPRQRIVLDLKMRGASKLVVENAAARS